MASSPAESDGNDFDDRLGVPSDLVYNGVIYQSIAAMFCRRASRRSSLLKSYFHVYLSRGRIHQPY
jgi:hypothetical protein